MMTPAEQADALYKLLLDAWGELRAFDVLFEYLDASRKRMTPEQNKRLDEIVNQ